MAQSQFGGLGAPINYYDMIPDFRREALQETENRLGQAKVTQMGMQNQQMQQDNQRKQQFYDAISNATPDQLPALRRQFPEYAQNIQQEIGIQDADHAKFVNGALNKIYLANMSGDPAQLQAAIQQSGPELASLGISPDQAMQMRQQDPERFSSLLNAAIISTLPVDKQVDVKQNQQKIDEAIRSNKAGEALTSQGQNLQYQASMTGHGLAAQRLALDKDRFGLEMDQAQQKAQQLINAAPSLSVNMEKSIEKSAGDAAASRNSADSMTTLADTLEKEKPTPGLFGSAENMYSKLTGQDNYLRDMRVRYNQLANAQATKLLPPGPASDKDIEFARKGIPSETDNPMVMSRWLKGMAKMESNNAKFNEFKSEWMSANGNPGQSDRNRNIMGMDIKQGESMNSAAKRFLSSDSPGSQQQAPAQAQTQQPATQTGIAEGTTATNPKTGQKIVFRSGQWQAM